MEEHLKPRATTKMALVHFTGEEAIDFAELKEQHLNEGLLEIGYHYMIEQDGKLLMGRHQSQVGAHYPQFDAVSIGICVVGEREDMSEKQSIALTLLLDKLQNDFPSLESVKYIYKTA